MVTRMGLGKKNPDAGDCQRLVSLSGLFNYVTWGGKASTGSYR